MLFPRKLFLVSYADTSDDRVRTQNRINEMCNARGRLKVSQLTAVVVVIVEWRQHRVRRVNTGGINNDAGRITCKHAHTRTHTNIDKPQLSRESMPRSMHTRTHTHTLTRASVY